jgi:hypothetical protein
LPNWSTAVTVKLNAVPVVAVAGAVTRNAAATSAVTLNTALPAVIAGAVAEMLRLPADFSVAVNEPVPPVNVVSAGSTAFGSVLVKCTVPAKFVAVLP